MKKYLFLPFLVFFLFVVSNSKGQKSNAPNVVLIMLDDLNDNTGFLKGHPQVKTPNMDELAQQSAVFYNAHANAPICGPSRSSLLTGIYPHVSGNFWFDKWFENPILKNCKSLPEIMGLSGYQTFGTGKLMHDEVESMWGQFGIPNDFGPYPFDGKKTVGHPSVPEKFRELGKNDGLFTSLADVPEILPTSDAPGYKGWRDVRNKKLFKYVNDDDRDLMNDELSANWAVEKIGSLEKANDAKPFFLAVGFVKPHTPLVAPQKYFDMYPLETLKIPEIKKKDKDDCYYLSTFDRFIPPWATYYTALKDSYKGEDEGLKKYLQAYLACVTFADDQVGKVIDALKKSKFNDNTIVILVSDHGYNHGEKDFLYKNNLWEKSTRVPLLIRTPKTVAKGGVKVNNPVSLVDIYPTIMDLCNIKEANMKNSNGAPLSGFSLNPFIESATGKGWKGPEVALTVVRGDFKSKDKKKQSYAVRSKEYRYILYVNGKEELYHNDKDPNEWDNLANDPKFSKIKMELKKQLLALIN
ncbi:sulfatase [Flavobacterium sp. 7A]|uniref:sulfatase n=1 Tax=Flavobacterium sp. 7A TaxID=2940571 RepID=UPI002227443F|nr:sulfatase [Flavobacterium sp. 7A]MCW2118813.1 arylsulfatase A-like enzyme [Flavobacterium sp. 7A]